MTPLALAPPNIEPLSITVSPQAASSAYLSAGMSDQVAGAEGASGFGATLQRAIEGAIGTGHEADRKSMQAIAGQGNITDVVTAVSKAQLSLQSAVAIRDKVVSAYQEIMRMTI